MLLFYGKGDNWIRFKIKKLQLRGKWRSKFQFLWLLLVRTPYYRLFLTKSWTCTLSFDLWKRTTLMQAPRKTTTTHEQGQNQEFREGWYSLDMDHNLVLLQIYVKYKILRRHLKYMHSSTLPSINRICFNINFSITISLCIKIILHIFSCFKIIAWLSHYSSTKNKT